MGLRIYAAQKFKIKSFYRTLIMLNLANKGISMTSIIVGTAVKLNKYVQNSTDVLLCIAETIYSSKV
jgi:hypothetical protein